LPDVDDDHLLQSHVSHPMLSYLCTLVVISSNPILTHSLPVPYHVVIAAF